jgi:hypothetical protein
VRLRMLYCVLKERGLFRIPKASVAKWYF